MRHCEGGHLMAAIPVNGAVRSVCLVCLSRCVGGPSRVRRGCEVSDFKLIDLITKLEKTESGDEFGTLDVTDVPGFDRLFAACDAVAVPFTSDGLRKMSRRLAARRAEPIEKILGMSPGTVAECVTRAGLRPERIPA